jgi:hypothetical protein
MNRALGTYSLFHLILIAILAAAGIAVKTVIVPLVHIITGPLFIPGGVVAGGIYMLFITLASSLTGKIGAGALCGFCQGIMVMIVGLAGSHGAFSLVSYSIPGIAADLVMLVFCRKEANMPGCFVSCMAANLTGTLIVNSAFFALPAVPLILSVSAGALSGGLGGIAAWHITKQMHKLNIIR